MQTASHDHRFPMNRYPQANRPYDMPPHSIGGIPNAGPPYPSNSNYNQYRYESDEHQTMRRTKIGPNLNQNYRGSSQQTVVNGKNKINNNNNSRDTDTNQIKPQSSQDDEGEEGEISESD